METTDGGRVELAKEGEIEVGSIGLVSPALELTLLIVLIDLGVEATVEDPRLKLVEACGFLRGGAPAGGGGGSILKTDTRRPISQP